MGLNYPRAPRRIVGLLLPTLILLSATEFGTATGEPSYLSSLPRLDQLRADAASVSRVENVDVISNVGEEDFAICHLVAFVPFSHIVDGERVSLDTGAFESGAAAMLAAQQLNVGDGSIVTEVGGLSDRCHIRFTVELVDTEYEESAAVDKIIQLTDRDPLPSRVRRQPCAILGAYRSAVSIPTSIISGLRGYPQLGVSTSAALDGKHQHPLFGRTIPSDDGTAVALVLFLRNFLNIRHLAIVHANDSYGIAYANGLNQAAIKYAPDLTVNSFDLRYKASPEEVKQTVSLLKETQNTFFFGVLFNADADAVMSEAFEQGVAGTGRHNWLFSDAVSSLANRKLPRTSLLARAYLGSGIIQATGGESDVLPEYDKFSNAMSNLSNEKDLAYFKSQLPSYAEGEDAAESSASNLFEDSTSFLRSLHLSPFVYDAAIALGLAACNATRGRDGAYFDGRMHFDAVSQSQPFNGATGKIKFDPVTGTRDPTSALFSVTNFVEDPSTSLDSTLSLKAIESHIYQDGEWVELHPYMFNDGTFAVPADLPEAVTYTNSLTKPLRAAGLSLCAIVVLLSVGFSAWTHWNRKARVVRASQPIFLQFLCAGALVMGSSIIPKSIDMGIASQRGCDIACMSFPWLLFTGFSAIFSALFTKTHRINKIMKMGRFQRITVTSWDVAKPMVGILGANIIILSIWTALSPLVWETVVVTTDTFGRPTETFGRCTGETVSLPYVITLAVINIGGLAFALYEAHQAKDLCTEYQESKYIMMILACILLVCFMGIPVSVIASENSEASFFAYSGIVFVTCCCVLLLMFVPKVSIHLAKEKEKKEKLREKGRRESILTTETEQSEGGIGIRCYSLKARLKEVEMETKQREKENQKLRQIIQRQRAGLDPSALKAAMDDNDAGEAENGRRTSIVSSLGDDDDDEDGVRLHDPSEDFPLNDQSNKRQTSVQFATVVEDLEHGPKLKDSFPNELNAVMENIEEEREDAGGGANQPSDTNALAIGR